MEKVDPIPPTTALQLILEVHPGNPHEDYVKTVTHLAKAGLASKEE